MATRTIHVALLDLADRASIVRFVANWGKPLRVLVNNIGGIRPILESTTDGKETFSS